MTNLRPEYHFYTNLNKPTEGMNNGTDPCYVTIENETKLPSYVSLLIDNKASHSLQFEKNADGQKYKNLAFIHDTMSNIIATLQQSGDKTFRLLEIGPLVNDDLSCKRNQKMKCDEEKSQNAILFLYKKTKILALSSCLLLFHLPSLPPAPSLITKNDKIFMLTLDVTENREHYLYNAIWDKIIPYWGHLYIRLFPLVIL